MLYKASFSYPRHFSWKLNCPLRFRTLHQLFEKWKDMFQHLLNQLIISPYFQYRMNCKNEQLIIKKPSISVCHSSWSSLIPSVKYNCLPSLPNCSTSMNRTWKITTLIRLGQVSYFQQLLPVTQIVRFQFVWRRNISTTLGFQIMPLI